MDGYHLKYSGEKVEKAIELALTEPERINSEFKNIKQQVEEKASKSTTLAGYNITDAYTILETEDAISNGTVAKAKELSQVFSFTEGAKSTAGYIKFAEIQHNGSHNDYGCILHIMQRNSLYYGNKNKCVDAIISLSVTALEDTIVINGRFASIRLEQLSGEDITGRLIYVTEGTNWSDPTTCPEETKVSFYILRDNQYQNIYATTDSIPSSSNFKFFDENYDDIKTEEELLALGGQRATYCSNASNADVSGKADKYIEDLRFYYGDENVVPTPEEYFRYRDNGDGTCAIIGLSQEGAESGITEIIFPYEINGLKVTSLETENFQATFYTLNPQKIIMPDTIKTIGFNAFEGDFSTLEYLRLSENLTTILEFNFNSVTNIDYLYVPDSLTVVASLVNLCSFASVVSMPHHSFKHVVTDNNDFSVTTLIIRGGTEFAPTPLESPSSPCFQGNDSKIILPDTCKTIGTYVFYNSENPTLVIPSSVTTIDGTMDTIFQECTNPTIICEQGSYADTWAKQYPDINVKYDIVDSEGLSGSSISITVDQIYNAESENPQSGKAIASELANKADKSTTLAGYGIVDAYTKEETDGFMSPIYSMLGSLDSGKADKSTTLAGYGITDSYTISQIDGILADAQSTFELKTRTESYEWETHICNFSECYNVDIRLTEILKSLSINIPNEVYEKDYTSGLSFNSGENPTSVNYTGTGILNWVGTDCSVSEGYSIFQPSPNTHYDIVFYYNGMQFVGLVNGFVPAIGNKAANVSGNEVA